MKRSLLIMVAMIPLAVLAAQANSESLSRPHLLPHEAGIRPEQTSSRLSLEDSMGMLVAASGTFAPGFHGSYEEPKKVSGQELNLLPVEKGSVSEGANTEPVLNGDDEEEGEDEDKDEEEGEDGKDEKEDEEEGEGWDRVWDAPKLG